MLQSLLRTRCVSTRGTDRLLPASLPLRGNFISTFSSSSNHSNFAMECSVTLARGHNGGNYRSKMVNHYKNQYRKEPSNLNNIVNQFCNNRQAINKPTETDLGAHMRTQSEAFQKYCAAFPALKKGEEATLKNYMPPPAWRPSNNNSNTQNSKEHAPKAKKMQCKDRCNSYHGPKKYKKRYNSYSKSLESKENLPEWVTHEGVWDIETQDSVKEFIRAIAHSEGFHTCKNTLTEDIMEVAKVSNKFDESKVPDWDDGPNFDSQWIMAEDLKFKDHTQMEEELYAKFEAKFDHSLEALWSKDQVNSPMDDYQDLPIDFHDLLSSPSDNQFFDPATEKCSIISLTESIWSNDAYEAALGLAPRVETPTKSIEVLHDRFKPLNIADETLVELPPSPHQELEPCSLYSYEDIYDAVPSFADIMHSLSTLNHSKDCSSFVEVIPRTHAERESFGEALQCTDTSERRVVTKSVEGKCEREDLLTSSSTHFRPISKDFAETEAELFAVRYADGYSFDISGDLDPAEFRRSPSGYACLDQKPEARYLEYRSGTLQSGRTRGHRASGGGGQRGPSLRLWYEVRHNEIAVQTEEPETRCGECGRGAKQPRHGSPGAVGSERGQQWACSCEPGDEREWDELLSEVSAARAQLAVEAAADRKRRHSASRAPRCSHPHAPFLHCFGAHRPLTR